MMTLENTVSALDVDRRSESACILDLADESETPRWRIGVDRVVFRTLRGGAAPSMFLCRFPPFFLPHFSSENF